MNQRGEEGRERPVGTIVLCFSFVFILLKSVSDDVRVYVCVCGLAFKGALLLAHVSMCVYVHLTSSVVVWRRMNALSLTSDLLTVLQCAWMLQYTLPSFVFSFSVSRLKCVGQSTAGPCSWDKKIHASTGTTQWCFGSSQLCVKQLQSFFFHSFRKDSCFHWSKPPW